MIMLRVRVRVNMMLHLHLSLEVIKMIHLLCMNGVHDVQLFKS